MTSMLIREHSAAQAKNRPEIRPGFTVRVHERIQEGNKERVQVFEGLVISMHKGHSPTDTSFTVRRIVSGVGTEKIFALHSPKIEKIEVKKVAKIRRAKLFFLRGRRGKSARLSERFTTAAEFALAAEIEEAPAEEEVQSAEDVSDSDSNEPTKEAEPEEASEPEESKEAPASADATAGEEEAKEPKEEESKKEEA